MEMIFAKKVTLFLVVSRCRFTGMWSIMARASCWEQRTLSSARTLYNNYNIYRTAGELSLPEINSLICISLISSIPNWKRGLRLTEHTDNVVCLSLFPSDCSQSRSFFTRNKKCVLYVVVVCSVCKTLYRK